MDRGEAAIEAREAFIRGDGPRITLIDIDNVPPEAQALREDLFAMAQTRDPSLVAPGPVPTILPLMLCHPELFRRQTDTGVQLLAKGALPPREREMAVLRVAWLCGAPYEWGEHVVFAKQAGVTAEELDRITEGPDAPGWTRHERAILMAVAELRADAMISDATWAVLAESYDDRQLIELPILIGQYQMVAYYQNALRVPLDERNVGLRAR